MAVNLATIRVGDVARFRCGGRARISDVYPSDDCLLLSFGNAGRYFYQYDGSSRSPREASPFDIIGSDPVEAADENRFLLGQRPDNVVLFPGPTSIDMPSERILDAAMEEDLAVVLVLGIDDEADLYFSSTTRNLATLNILLEKAKKVVSSWL